MLQAPQVFSVRGLKLYFPALEPWVVWSISLPSCSSQFICPRMWDRPVCQLPPCHESSPPWLSVSTPPAGLGECFFFHSLVVGLPYSLIFCHFWLFLVLKLLSFWLCKEAQCVYLHLHLGQNRFFKFF